MESKLKLYNIDSDYIDFLQSYELSKRGFTKVSNNANSAYLNKKAYIGVVFKIKGMHYFAPLTHPKQHYESSSNFFDRLSMRIYKSTGNEDVRELGRIMFCYMIPLAREPDCLDFRTVSNKQYRKLLYMQYHFINQNKCAIENQAMKLYNQIYNKKHYLSQFCCDFHLLEEGCKQWSYNNLKIELKEEYQMKEYIIIDDLKNIFSIIDMNEYGYFLRYEELSNNGELRKIRIYVQDCFMQEKYVDVILKIMTPILEENNFMSTYSEL